MTGSKHIIWIEDEDGMLEVSVSRMGEVTIGPAYDEKRTWARAAEGIAQLEKAVDDAGLKISRHPELPFPS